jgi:hypothetical protein
MKNKTAFFYAMILLFVSTGVFAQLGGDQKLNVNALANNRLISASNPNVVADVIPASVQTTPVKNIKSYFTTKAGVTTYGNELRFRTVDGSK